MIFFGLAQAVEQHGAAARARSSSRSSARRGPSFDVKAANALLDEIGLTKRDADGLRLLPDGRPLEIIVETAGESTEETDVLELIRDGWRKVGITLFSRPSQREVFRNRVFSGQTMMSVWSGLDNGLATADMSPDELAPAKQEQLQWPKWGTTSRATARAGSHRTCPRPRSCSRCTKPGRRPRTAPSGRGSGGGCWRSTPSSSSPSASVTGNLQPVVVNRTLRNVPPKALYNWDPGAYFGMYHPDTFWLDAAPRS